MISETIFFVVTPQGHIWHQSSHNGALAGRLYVREWLPEKVVVSDYVLDDLWRAFQQSGYRIEAVDLPEQLKGREVCRT